MEHGTVQWVTELMMSAGMRTSSSPAYLETRSKFEILAGNALLNQGALQRATELFDAAATHVLDPANKRDLATQLLALARAWDQEKEGSDTNMESERALRQAVELDPVQGLPALARHLQRQKRLPDAINRLREAIQLNPQDSSLYLNLARAHEQSGQAQQALSIYLELIAAAPSARNYLVVAQRLEALASRLSEVPVSQTVRIALLGNATLDHLQSYLRVEFYRAGIRPLVYQTGFDQYMQDILRPESQLYSFSPEVVICAIHASRLFPSIHHYPFNMPIEERRNEMDAGLHTLQMLLDALTERSTALVLLHNMVAPQFPALGISDWRDELGQAEIFAQINARLAAMVREQYKNVYVVDEDRIQARSGKGLATDPRLWLSSRMGWSDGVLSGLAKEYLRYIKPYMGLSRKCIVLDLDDTLWGGVVGEDGVSGIQVGPEAPGNSFVAFQRELERLWRRGILLAISSKNNEADVMPVFEQHSGMILTLSHFAAQRINWKSKAENVREIAKELNIGLESMVFLDDNPVERAVMRSELPQVLTPDLPVDPAYYRQVLLDLDVFDTLGITDEDRRRNQLYGEEKARRQFESSRALGRRSLDEHLAALEMFVDIEPVDERTLPRVAQLINKTNQFNLTTRRYSEAQISEMQSLGSGVFGMRVADRFGDSGLVGVAILTPKDVETKELDILLLSCRVMGRGAETALLAFLAGHARRSGIRRLQGWYLPTAKNDPVKDCYPSHSFVLVEHHPDGSQLWELDLATAAIQVPGWLTLRTGVNVG